MSFPAKFFPKPVTIMELHQQRGYLRSVPCHVFTMLTAIVLAGLALRVHQLASRSVWFDEAFSWRLIQFPFVEMLQRAGRDVHPPLYYIVLKGWAILFGDSTFALRSLSVLFGGLTILGTYLFATEAFGTNHFSGQTNSELQARGRVIGLIAAALVAFSAFHIRYSQELRMYTMAAALAAFSSWALFWALRPPSGLRSWLLYALFALLLAYTHYYGLFTLAAQAVFVAAFLLARAEWSLSRGLRDQTLRHALLAATVVLIGWLPWLPIFLSQRAQVQASFWSFSTTCWDVALLCYNMFTMGSDYGTPPYQGRLLATAVSVLILLLLARKAGTSEWYIFVTAVSPLLGSFVFSAPLVLRFFIMSHLYLLIGIAVLIWRVPYRAERCIVLAMTLSVFGGLYYDYCRDLDASGRPGARGAAFFLYEHRLPGEPVIVCMPFFYFPLLHHTSDREEYFLYDSGQSMPHFYGTAAMIPQDLITDEQMQRLHSRRVWVVDMGGGIIGAHWCPVPTHWKAKSQHYFSEVAPLGDAIVVEYEIDSNQEQG